MFIKEEVLRKFKFKVDISSVKRLDISDEEYFGKKYSNYISNSKLKLINPDEGGSFLSFLKGLKSSSTSSLNIGSAVHELILQPEEFELSDQLKPSAKAGMMVDSIFKYRQQGKSIHESILRSSQDVEYYKTQLTSNRIKILIKSGLEYYIYLHKSKNIKFDKEQIILDSGSKETCIKCVNSLRGHSDAMSLIHPDTFSLDDIINKNEDTIIFDIIVTFPNSTDDPSEEEVSIRLKLKAKIDNWNVNLSENLLLLNDLKTTGKRWYMFPGSTVNETGEFLEGSFQHYHYYRQLAMYYWMLKIALKASGIETKHLRSQLSILAVQTIPNYSSVVFRIPKKWVIKGLEEMRKLLCYAAYAEYNREEILNDAG